MKSNYKTDYIVVGAGSSGCVLANRLSKNADNKVILLEAGKKDTNPWIHIPVGYFRTMHNPAVDWCYETENDPGLNGRSLKWPRGKVLGGSSSLNGLLYVRGQPEDYDRWQQMGNSGWSWDQVLPYFIKSEHQERITDEFHGQDGPLTVSDMRLKRPICDAWIEAATNTGYEFNSDYNGPKQEGVGYFQQTVRNGLRCSAAVAFLNPIKKRPNLKILTESHTTKINFDNNRATGVTVQFNNGEIQEISATKEVILATGSIGSPQLLMLSGIGDHNQLKQHGIEIIQNLPGVGKNLQDHLQARLVYKCYEPTLNDEVRSVLNKLKIGLNYIFTRRGPMTMAASLATGFLKTRPEVATPDIQFHIQPWSADSPGEGVHPFSAFTASVCQLRPESKGEIKLNGNNPFSHPKIFPNYLSTPTDCQTIIDGVKVARKISDCAPLSKMISAEFQPGETVVDDESILDWVRNCATTIFHPTGTCKMGSDSMAVVNNRLQVIGTTNLRVADCSIMPEIVSGNTNAPAIMIGEKASDMILEDNQ